MPKPDDLTIDYSPTGRNGRVTLTARLAGEPIAVEAVNLAKSKDRAAFVASVCEGRPGIDAKAVEAELLRIAAELASKPERDENPSEPAPDDLLQKMPEAVRERARVMLESPNVIGDIESDIGRLGIAGEQALATLIYMVGVSRLLPQPLAIIIQGPSSSGKSYVLERVASLFPPESVTIATKITPEALFYLKPGSLSHRFIIVGERSRIQDDQNAEATRALREMLSSGKLSKLGRAHK